MDKDLGYSHLPAKGRCARDILQATSVGTARGQASHYLVLFGNLILDLEMEAGKGGTNCANVLFFGLEAGHLAVWRTVVDVADGDYLVCYGNVPLVIALFELAADNGLVLHG